MTPEKEKKKTHKSVKTKLGPRVKLPIGKTQRMTVAAL